MGLSRRSLLLFGFGEPAPAPLPVPGLAPPPEPPPPVLEGKAGAGLGALRVRLDACWAAQGSICEVCGERCPTRPKAITVRFGSAPVLRAEHCTGCGLCAWFCPAGAIDVLAGMP